MILAYYLANHPKSVESLTLLSPLGCHRFSDAEMEQKRAAYAEQTGVMGKLRMSVMGFVFDRRLTPSWFMSSLVGRRLINNGLESRLGLRGEELELWVDFMRCSSESGANS
jgi:hypothetical protein